MLRFQVNNKKLVFIEDIPENLPEYVMTDQRRLRQILINLLSNAIKFTPSGSVSFSVRWNMEIATFEIRDTGIGIPDSDIERIQEPFQRSSHPDSHRIQGTGLGLTITRLLVQILGVNSPLKVQSDKAQPVVYVSCFHKQNQKKIHRLHAIFLYMKEAGVQLYL